MLSFFVRMGMLKGFIPVYEFILRKYIGITLSLKVRNSILKIDDYSPFLSDLDLAAVGEFSEIQAHRLRVFHENLKYTLIFLGEIEIYSPSEWDTKILLLQKLEPYYTPLRLLRKIHWMLRLIQTCSSLAGLRARRGLKRALNRLGINSLASNKIAEGDLELLESVFEKITDEMALYLKLQPISDHEPFEYYHPWLEVTFTNKKTAPVKKGHIRCSEMCGYLLAAIFPPRTYYGIDQKKIDDLRSFPQVDDYLRAFAKHELIIMTASVRGLNPLPQWYSANLVDLNHWSAL